MSSDKEQLEASQPDYPGVIDKTELKYSGPCDLTLDPNTACSYLLLSDGDTKATFGKWQGYPENSERFNPYPQVLCSQGLKERHYFEVEWSSGSNNEVGVGLAYRNIPRKGDAEHCGFGYNNLSWYFGISNNYLRAFHDNKPWTGNVPSGGCNRIGVYLDWSGGALTFYRVSSNGLTLLYTFKDTFTAPLFPGLYMKNQSNYAALFSV
ncbi:stonustoxin subunit alpha [Kryptolebias marmoratus]|uniref:stonustoxin subunit alpha n=1 Tax=Kryptolebias marmoratus TaxID=37003 RepID=UPI0007F93ACB|nr:stonustoxin subunit alpha [Kryptolebias marmoratus]